MKMTKENGNGWLRVWAAAGMILMLLLIYLGMALFFSSHFLPGTVINGIPVSGNTVRDVKWKIIEETDQYEIRIEAREGKEEILKGSDIGVTPVFDGSLEENLQEQNCLAWPLALFRQTQIHVETMIEYNEKRFRRKVNELEIMDAANNKKPVNARISEYSEENLYTIIPEEQGTKIKKKRFLKHLQHAVINLQDVFSLEEEGCYAKPKITRESEELQNLVKQMNYYAQVRVTYQFGKKKEVLDGREISSWFVIDEENNVSVPGEQIVAYVDRLADKWDTVGKVKQLKTADGAEVEVEGGDYGWKIDREKETEELANIIQSGGAAVREPAYEKTANSRGKRDYGNTYVEVNLSAQHLVYHKDGEIVLESDFVSGNEAKGWSTPTGAYSLYYKERNRTLRGQGYASPVSFWMPFNGGVGFHDAKWRGSFGGSYYKRNGSHGCINLPYSAAKTLYDNIEAGCAILVY